MFILLQELHIQQMIDIFRSMNGSLSELLGIIGPNGPSATNFWAPVFQRSDLITVSD